MLCPSCHNENISGAIFCLNCGISLLSQDRTRDTTAMLGARPAARSAATAQPVRPPVQPAGERRLRATVLNNGRQINLPLAAPIMIGRQDNARGFFPDLDLSNDGGYESGVSRRHARIVIVNDATCVEDLESANGTFVNDQRLPPRAPQRLQPTDELRCGSLILRIEQT